jgi:hypothetical protein
LFLLVAAAEEAEELIRLAHLEVLVAAVFLLLAIYQALFFQEILHIEVHLREIEGAAVLLERPVMVLVVEVVREALVLMELIILAVTEDLEHLMIFLALLWLTLAVEVVE